MTWHNLLLTAETALVWSTVAGLVASVFAWRPLRKLLHLLDASTPGGIGDLIQNAGPPPDPPRRPHGRP